MDLFNLGSQDPQGTLEAVGQHALDSGQVTKSEAKKMQKVIGKQDPGDFLNNYLFGGKKKSPYMFGDQPEQNMSMPSNPLQTQEDQLFSPMPAAQKAALAAPAPAAPVSPLAMTQSPLVLPEVTGLKKNEVLKTNQAKTTGEATKRVTDTHLSPDNWAQLTGQLRDTPEVKAQADELKKFEDQINMLKGMKGDNEGWVKPLLALADAQKPGSNLVGGYNDQGSQKKNEMLLKYQDELQKRKQDMAKTILEAGTKLKSGHESQDAYSKLLESKLDTLGQGPSAFGMYRMESLKMKAGNDFDNDARLKPMENVFDNLDKATSFIEGDTPITASVFNTLQDDLSTAIRGGGGNIADAARQRDQLHSLQQSWNELEAKVGKITDMRTEAPQLFKQLQSMVATVRRDVEKAYGRRIDQKLKNYSGSDPDIQAIAREKAADMKAARITGKALPDIIHETKVPTSASPKRTKELKDMSQAELDAYEASLHGG